MPRPASPVPVTSRAWLPALAAGFQAVALLVVLVTAASAATVTTSTVGSFSVAGDPAGSVTESAFLGSIGAGIFAFFAALPFWLVVVVLVGLSALWVGREKLLLLALMPVCALAFAVLPEIGYRLFDMNGVYTGASASIALAVLGGGVVVGVLTRRAHHRATALAPS